MLAWVNYSVRLVAAVVMIAIGLIMVYAAINAKPRTTSAVVVSGVIAAAGLLSWPRRPNAWRRDRPTERQLAYANKLGIPVTPGMSKGDVSDMISQMKDL